LFFHTRLVQNRAYAVSQIVDLHQKLSKAQASVSSTRAPIPAMKGQEEKASSVPKVNYRLTVCALNAHACLSQKEEKKKEDNQLAKGVKDR
jgi:COP9 signalosome complex subunit 5